MNEDGETDSDSLPSGNTSKKIKIISMPGCHHTLQDADTMLVLPHLLHSMPGQLVDSKSKSEDIRMPECKQKHPDADAEIVVCSSEALVLSRIVWRDMRSSSGSTFSGSDTDSDSDVDEYDPNKPIKVHCDFGYEEGWWGMRRLRKRIPQADVRLQGAIWQNLSSNSPASSLVSL